VLILRLLQARVIDVLRETDNGDCSHRMLAFFIGMDKHSFFASLKVFLLLMNGSTVVHLVIAGTFSYFS
jgi:hypothetical protein